MASESGHSSLSIPTREAQNKGGDSDPKKRLSIERIYQKKSQLEHILLRPDTYIGTVEAVTQNMWVIDEAEMKMVSREVTFVPGLYKIFDEILVNAADNKQRDPTMSCIKIDIKPEDNMIKIWNNGKGIPVTLHKGENMYVPTMIFGHLLTSSNFDDDQKKVTGGRNGYGAKLCNVFSTKFVVETCSAEFGKKFKQTWSSNMTKAVDAQISDLTGSNSEDYTSVTFYPDLAKFKMQSLDNDIVSVFTRRAYDIAACSGCKVFLNGKRLPITNFKQYIELFTKDHVDDNGTALKMVYEKVTPRWEVAIVLSEKGFQQVSFVNSIATTKGGRHVDYIVDQLTGKLAEVVKKKNSKSSVAVKPFQIKNHLWVFVNCLIENPTFDSQTKENMTLQAKTFGSKCELPENFIKNVQKCGIVESIMTWVKFKEQAQLNQMCTGRKKNTIKGIPKLDDANEAGTKNSDKCTLILTEGDSAKTLAVAGLSVIGRDHYGVFPLRGKVLNVREASAKQIVDNAEINSLIRILGLQYKQPYDSPDSIKSLRYGRIMIMTDQDQDGSHIKGLIVNFIHHNWPNLIKHGFIEQFITPIIKVSKGREDKSFYSIPEFEEWKRATANWHTWRVKYYKGLGTSTSNEAKEYFSDMARHRIRFGYGGQSDDDALLLAFSKKKIEDRKEWLTNWMEDRKHRLEQGQPELYLYTKETKQVTFNDFVNRELILFSNMDNERSIPSLMDGFKPGQRKVLFACLKLNQFKEVKVAQLAGTVAFHSAYHHGEQSLMSTIVNLAQNFVGSNNVNLLKPLGQFGTRLHGGKDSASARYIFTALSSLTRLLFHKDDDAILRYLFDDNQRIEPDYYVPIIPMVLVNGASGIGTGWSTNLPNFNPREIVSNIRRMLNGDSPVPLLPWFKGFRGEIRQLSEQRFATFGEVAVLDDNTIEITELPIGIWTQDYKEKVLEIMQNGSGDKVPPVIDGYKEYHTDVTVRFVVKMAAAKLAEIENQTGNFYRFFKLVKCISTSSMVLFDHNECLRRYANVEEITKEFYNYRSQLYVKRKDYLVGALQAECKKLENQARFIQELIDSKIDIRKMKRKDLIALLIRNKYESDPLKFWKEEQAKKEKREVYEEQDGQANGQGDEPAPGGDAETDEAVAITRPGQSGHPVAAGQPDFNYLLTMHLWSLTYEDIAALMNVRDKKLSELEKLRRMSPNEMWSSDLDKFIVELDNVEKGEREAAEAALTKAASKMAKGGRAIKSKLPGEDQTKPSPGGRRIEPSTDWLKLTGEAPAKKGRGKGAKDPDQRDLLDFWGPGGAEGSDAEVEAANAPIKSLAERLGRSIDSESELGDGKKKAKKTTTTAPKKPRTAGGASTTAASTAKPAVTTTKAAPAKEAASKPTKKRKHGSGSEDESSFSPSEVVTLSDSDDEAAPRREVRERKTAVNYAAFGEDSSEELNKPSSDSFDIDDDDDEFKPEPKKASPVKPKAAPSAPAPKPPAPKPAAAAPEKPAAEKPKAPPKPKAPTKKPASDDDDSDSDFGAKKKKSKPAKKAAASDDDDDSDFGGKKKKAPAKKPAAPKAAPAKKKVVLDESESEGEGEFESQPRISPTVERPKRAAAKVAASKYVVDSDSEEEKKSDNNDGDMSDIDYD